MQKLRSTAKQNNAQNRKALVGREGGGRGWGKKCISHCLKYIPAQHVGNSLCKYFHKAESHRSGRQTDRRNQYECPTLSLPLLNSLSSDCLLFQLSTEIDAPGVNWSRQSVSIKRQRGGGGGGGRFRFFFPFFFPSSPRSPSSPPVGGM